jgi:hypothetical protein
MIVVIVVFLRKNNQFSTFLVQRPNIFGQRPNIFGQRPNIFGQRPNIFGQMTFSHHTGNKVTLIQLNPRFAEDFWYSIQRTFHPLIVFL